MKVWVILKDYDYEGYGEPLVVCASEKAAQAWVDSHRAPGEYMDIFAMEVEGDND